MDTHRSRGVCPSPGDFNIREDVRVRLLHDGIEPIE